MALSDEYSWLIILGIIIIFTLITTYFYYQLDKHEPEPLSRIVFAFFLGLVSIIPAIIIELIVVLALSTNSDFIATVFVAPIVEEICKGLFVLHLAKHENFDGPLDGLIYGAMVGAGFAAGENMLYGLNFSGQSGLGFGIFLTTIRSISQIIGHPLYTGLVGAGIGEAKVGLQPNKFSQLWRAMLLHAMWNGASSIPSYGFFLGVIVVVTSSIIVLRNELKLAIKLDNFMHSTGYYQKKGHYAYKPNMMYNWNNKNEYY